MTWIDAVRQVVRDEAPSRLDIGIIEAVIDQRSNMGLVSVRILGSGRVCSRALSCLDVSVGDRVVVARLEGEDLVIVLAKVNEPFGLGKPSRAVMAPPSNLAVVTAPGVLVVHWDTYPGLDLCWLVEHNSEPEEGGEVALLTRGSYYLYFCEPGVTHHFRVRALRWLGANNVRYSAWSQWVSGTSTSWDHRYYREDEIGATLSPSGAALVGVEDTGGYFAASNVEEALQELASSADVIASGRGVVARFFVDGRLVVASSVGGVFPCPFDGQIESVSLYCQDTGRSGATTIDVNKNGVSIFGDQSGRPSLSFDDSDGMVFVVLSVPVAVSCGDVLTIDIDEVAAAACCMSASLFVTRS